MSTVVGAEDKASNQRSSVSPAKVPPVLANNVEDTSTRSLMDTLIGLVWV